MLLAASIAAPAVASIGCVENRNLRLAISDDVALDSFPPRVVETTIDASGEAVLPPPPADDEPTIKGLDRSGFTPFRYRVPIDGTRHEYAGRDHLAYPSRTARQRGEFPTAVSALETGGPGSTRDQVIEVALQPVVGTISAGWRGVALLWPETLLATVVSGSASSPGDLFERVPQASQSVGTGVIHETSSNESGPDAEDAGPEA